MIYKYANHSFIYSNYLFHYYQVEVEALKLVGH